MDQELGLMLMKDNNELFSEFEMGKDRSSGPVVFSSHETDNMFILKAHLKGYNRGNLKVGTIKDANLIAISGEKLVTETIMVDWKVSKKETRVQGFNKVFKIPDNVISDMIESRFNDKLSILSIKMPKKVKVMQGISIEEVEESKYLVNGDYGYESVQILNEEKSSESTSLGTQKLEEAEKKADESQERVEHKEIDKSKQNAKDGERQVKSDGAQRCKMCTVLGSALLVSLVAFVIHVVKAKNQNRRHKD